MAVGETKDAGWEIGVSRTVPLTPDKASARIAEPAAWAHWTGVIGRLFP